MATKSKNKLSVAAWGLLTMSIIMTLLLAADIWGHRDFLHKDYYFNSYPFYNQLSNEMEIIKYIHFDNKNYPQLSRDEKLKTERISWLRGAYERQKQEAETAIREETNRKVELALKDGSEATTSKFLRELPDKIALAQADITKRLDKDINDYIAYRDREYAEVRQSLEDRNPVWSYYIKDVKTGEVFTNLPATPDLNMLDDQALYWTALPKHDGGQRTLQWIDSFFKQNRLEGVVFVPMQVKGHSQVHADYEYYLAIRDRIIKEGILAGICLLLAVVALICIRRYNLGIADRLRDISARYRRIPFDVRLIILVIAVLYFLDDMNSASVFRLPMEPDIVLHLLLLCGLAAFAVAHLPEVGFLYRNPDELRRQWQTAWLNTLTQLVKRSLTNRNIFFKAVLLFMGTVLLGIVVMLAGLALSKGVEQFIIVAGVYIGLYLLLILPYILRRIAAFNSILQGTKAIAAGNLTYAIDVSGNGNLRRLAGHLNNMKMGFVTSVETQIKSERLKTELITNVSHDLKTPLTSIINYVDLLKNKDISDEERQTYMDVLDRKTQRLKALIEDLFEASKMASGSVELNLENVNVTSLLEQALAEFNEQMEASSCTFKVMVPDHKIVCRLDGKKTWRVFENLIGNALKYAMPQTRVHVSLTEDDRQVFFTIKNVSAYAIDFAAEELLERFKRADQSRHTEGSGLGLSIAKSIVDLQGGQLHIEIDGDYFKVSVTFNK